MKRTALDIYQYTDYRDYLKDRLAELKAQDRKYSLRFLAKKLGLSSNSHLKMVMDGDHNLSLELGRKLADFLNLRKQETDFFLIFGSGIARLKRPAIKPRPWRICAGCPSLSRSIGWLWISSTITTTR